MGKDSKKRKADRKNKRIEWEMKKQLHQMNVDKIQGQPSLIPPLVAVNPSFDELREHLNSENYKLIFATYNFNECQLHRLANTGKSKALIQFFNKVTKTNKSNFLTSGIIRDNIYNNKPYCSFFKTIPPDTDLKEGAFGGEGRIFFYLIQNFFCIVAIQTQHKNI